MLSCNKGDCKASGGFIEVMADWTTLTTFLYEHAAKSNTPTEDLNAVFTKSFFLGITTAQKRLEKEVSKDDES